MSGLSHITLLVKDLDLASEFFKSVFGAKEVYSSGDETFSLSKEKFFLIGDIWICAMQGDPPACRTYDHIAFKIDEGELDGYAARIKSVGAQIRQGRPRAEGEGKSLYFYDFDNHLFELHTGTLADRLAAYAK